MNATFIEERLRLGEDSVTEFKSVARNAYRLPDGFAKEVAGLANTRGGRVLVGVDDDGTVSGTGDLKQTDELMRQISQICQDAIFPSLWCTVEKVVVRGQTVLVVEVPGFSPGRPYRVGHAYHIRDANRTREATGEELIRLLESAEHHFDEQPVDGSSREDIDDDSARQFLVGAYDEAEVSEKLGHYLYELGCVHPEGQATVAGILLFGRQPQRWLPDARVSAVRFRGTEISSTFADQKEIGGRLLDQLDEAVAFLRTHAPSPSRVEGLQRKKDEIPEKVLREALTNALTHRDYRPAAQVRILVFDDRVEITNPGALLNRLTVENIRLGISQRRNPRIASLLARSAHRESLGVGVPEMYRLMKENGLPDPQISSEAGHFRLVLRMPPTGSA